MNARQSSSAIVIAIIFFLAGCAAHRFHPDQKPRVAERQVTEGHQLFQGPLVVTAPAP